MISEEKLQKALTYLAETDVSCAKAKGLMVGLNKQEKTIVGTLFLETKGQGGVEERKSIAYESVDYINHTIKVEKATVDYEIMNNKRTTATLIVEVWRTYSANKRKGNI